MLFFTIITPAYNVEEFLPKCVQSILNQTNSNWEMLLTDDGSFDSTGYLLDKYARFDSRIACIHQANEGVSSARNTALELGKGTWFCFLDGDDFFHPQYLEICSCQIVKNPDIPLVLFRVITAVNPSFRQTRYTIVHSKLQSVRTQISPTIWDSGLWSAIYQRSAYPDLRFGPYNMGEDLLFFRLWLLHISKILFLDCPLYAYRQRAGSAVHSPFDATKIISFMSTSMICLMALLTNNKLIVFSQYSLLLKDSFEWAAHRCLKLTSGTEVNIIFRIWLEFIILFLGNPVCRIPRWYSARSYIILKFHSLFLWYLLMAWPLRLWMGFRVVIIKLKKLWGSRMFKLFQS